MKFLFASRIEIYFNVESEKIIDEITVTSIRSFRVPSKIIIEHIYVYINIGRYIKNGLEKLRYITGSERDTRYSIGIFRREAINYGRAGCTRSIVICKIFSHARSAT